MSRSTLVLQVGMLARRSVVRTFRQPAMVVPALLAENSAPWTKASASANWK